MGSYEVQIESVISAAESLSEKGREISTALKAAYASISDLGSSRSWVGNQYDKVVDSLNNNLDALNSLINTASTDIPNALGIAAQNYAIGDGISVRSVNLDYVPTIESVSKASHRTGEIIYKDTEVDNAVLVFSNEFKNVSNCIQNYKFIFNTICDADWVGSAMEQYRSVVDSFATTAATSSADINTTIINGVKDSQEALSGAESNTQAAASNVSVN